MERRRRELLDEAITRSIIGTFYDVHRALGFGYREHIYALAMERDLVAKGHQVDREVAVMIHYRGEPLARQTMDMIVDKRVIVENKATEYLHPGVAKQLSGYLTATIMEVGLILHFGRKPKFRRMICENRFKRFSN